MPAVPTSTLLQRTDGHVQAGLAACCIPCFHTLSHAYSTTEERSRLLGVIKNLSSDGIHPFSPSNVVFSVTMYLLNTTCCSYPLRCESKIRDDDIMQAVENCALSILLAICRSTSERCGKPDRRA